MLLKVILTNGDVTGMQGGMGVFSASQEILLWTREQPPVPVKNPKGAELFWEFFFFFFRFFFFFWLGVVLGLSRLLFGKTQG